jgi:hypothetical protein
MKDEGKIIFHFSFVILDLSLKKTRSIQFLPMINLKSQMKNDFSFILHPSSFLIISTQHSLIVSAACKVKRIVPHIGSGRGFKMAFALPGKERAAHPERLRNRR